MSILTRTRSTTGTARIGLRALAVAVLWLAHANLIAQTASTPTVQFPTVADMVAARIPATANRLTALVSGRVSTNDGGGGTFFYDSSSAASTNLGTIFKPTASAGRWLRQYSGTVNVKWFGALGDNSGNDAVSIQNAVDSITIWAGPFDGYGKGSIYFPAGIYRCTDVIELPDAITVYGDGTEGMSDSGGSIINGVHAGDAVFSLLGAAQVTIRNLKISGQGPETLLLLARKGSASAGKHLFQQVTVSGNPSKAVIYSIGSEENLYERVTVELNGNSTSDHVFYTSSSDDLSVSADIENAVVNTMHMFNEVTFNNLDSTLSINSTAFYADTDRFRYATFNNCYFVNSQGSYVKINVSGHSRPFLRFINCGQENAVAGGLDGLVFTPSALPVALTTVTRGRTNNIATVTTSAAHGLQSGDIATVSGLGGVGYNTLGAQVRRTDATTFTWYSPGPGENTTADVGGSVLENHRLSNITLEQTSFNFGITATNFPVYVGNSIAVSNIKLIHQIAATADNQSTANISVYNISNSELVLLDDGLTVRGDSYGNDYSFPTFANLTITGASYNDTLTFLNTSGNAQYIYQESEPESVWSLAGGANTISDIANGGLVINDRATAATTVTLPIAKIGRDFKILAINTNTITVVAGGSDTFAGQAFTGSLASSGRIGEFIRLVCTTSRSSGVNGVWTVVDKNGFGAERYQKNVATVYDGTSAATWQTFMAFQNPIGGAGTSAGLFVSTETNGEGFFGLVENASNDAGDWVLALRDAGGTNERLRYIANRNQFFIQEGQRVKRNAQASPYQILETDYYVSVTTTGAVTLPDASTLGSGTVLMIKSASGVTTTVTAGAGDTVEGAASVSLASLESGIFISDGVSNWERN